jgi:sRNA-binding carbon storage regulator CsrA
MLVLSRKANERIRVEIPPSSVTRVVELILIETRGPVARLGLEADEDITFTRTELLPAATSAEATTHDGV